MEQEPNSQNDRPHDNNNIPSKKEKINSNSQKEIFLQKAIHYLKTRGGIATIEEMFKIAETVWEKYSWTKTKLEKIRDLLVQSNQALQIDIAVPHPKPVKIYEGRHKVQRTIFFALPNESYERSVERAKSILQGMTNQALQLEKEKSKIKKRKQQEQLKIQNEDSSSHQPQNIVQNLDQNNSNIFEDTQNPLNLKTIDEKKQFECLNPLYFSSRRHQAQILHFFIITTFGLNAFTISDLFEHFTVDLYLKLFNGLSIPRIFVKEPRLCSILLPYLPKQYQELFHFEKAPTPLGKLLKFLSNTLKILINPTFDTFQALSCVSIEFPNDITCTFDISTPEGVIDFWKAYLLSELFESSDTLGSLFLKHYMIKPQASNLFLTTSLRNILLPLNYKIFPYNFFSTEELVRKLAINWVFLKNSLIALNFSKIPDFKQLWNESLAYKVSQSPVLTFNSIPQNLRKIETISDEQFEVIIKNLEQKTALAIITGISEISTGNCFLEGNHPWSKINSLFQQYSPQDLEFNAGKVHMNLYPHYRDYRDLYDETRAFFLANSDNAYSQFLAFHFSEDFSSDQFNNISNNNLRNNEKIQMMVHEINEHFRIWKLGRKMPPFLGELVERLKIVLFSQKYNFPVSVLTKFLYEIDTSDSNLEEAILFLQLCGFLFLSHERVYTFNRMKLTDLAPLQDKDHFKKLNDVDRYVKLYALSSFDLNASSLFYLLNNENEFHFDIQFNSDIELFQSFTNVRSLSAFVKKILYSFHDQINPLLSYIPYPSIRFIANPNENKNLEEINLNNKEKEKKQLK